MTLLFIALAAAGLSLLLIAFGSSRTTTVIGCTCAAAVTLFARFAWDGFSEALWVIGLVVGTILSAFVSILVAAVAYRK
jgi:hypothetical protein